MSKYEIYQKQDGTWEKVGGTDSTAPTNMMTTDTQQTLLAAGKKTYDLPIASQEGLRMQYSDEINPSITDVRPDGVLVSSPSATLTTKTLYGNGTIHNESNDVFEPFSADITLPKASGELMVKQSGIDYVTTTGQQEISGRKTFTVGTNTALVIRNSSSELYKMTISPTQIYIDDNYNDKELVIGPGNLTYTSGTQNYNQQLPAKSGTFAMTSDIPTVPTDTTKYDGNAIVFEGSIATFNTYCTYTTQYGAFLLVQISTNANIITTSTADVSVKIGTLVTDKSVAHTMATGVVYSRTTNRFEAVNVEINADKTVYIYHQAYMGICDGLRFNGVVRCW